MAKVESSYLQLWSWEMERIEMSQQERDWLDWSKRARESTLIGCIWNSDGLGALVRVNLELSCTKSQMRCCSPVTAPDLLREELEAKVAPVKGG